MVDKAAGVGFAPEVHMSGNNCRGCVGGDVGGDRGIEEEWTVKEGKEEAADSVMLLCDETVVLFVCLFHGQHRPILHNYNTV